MRIINRDETALSEALEGLMLTEPGSYCRLETEYGYGLYRQNMAPDRVRIIVDGGGSMGRMWSGCARDGMADAMVMGEFDSAPNAYTIYEMAKTIDCGKGVLFLTNNFMGDYLNNDMAVELLSYDGIKADTCLISDDICSARGQEKEKRGGLTGVLQVAKAAFAAAAAGLSLEEVKKVAEAVNYRTRSLTVLISEDGFLFYGPGFSGEAPMGQSNFVTADRYAQLSIDILLEDFDEIPEKVFLNISRMRKMSFAEGMVLINSSVKYLNSRGIEVVGCSAGSYFDVFESSGNIFTMVAVDDEVKDFVGSGRGYDFNV